MSITRKWPVARFEHDELEGGSWVIVQRDEGIVGMMVDFPDEPGLLLSMGDR